MTPELLEKFHQREPDLDLGDDHWLWYLGWYPDRALNPQYEQPDGSYPAVEKYGAWVGHLSTKTETGVCLAAVTFDIPESQLWHTGPKWRVDSWDPLTLSPSLLCQAPTPQGPCGDHGFIRAGTWVRA